MQNPVSDFCAPISDCRPLQPRFISCSSWVSCLPSVPFCSDAPPLGSIYASAGLLKSSTVGSFTCRRFFPVPLSSPAGSRSEVPRRKPNVTCFFPTMKKHIGPLNRKAGIFQGFTDSLASATVFSPARVVSRQSQQARSASLPHRRRSTFWRWPLEHRPSSKAG
jgi:hypothetical protein